MTETLRELLPLVQSGKPSCISCPAALEANVAVSKFKRNIGGPVCGRFGTPIGSPRQSTEDQVASAAAIAKACPKYGEPMPPTPESSDMTVAIPHPAGEISPDDSSLCTSCSMCKNFIAPTEVFESYGWAVGMCAVKGKLILTHDERREASNCDLRAFGTRVFSARDVELLPEYRDGFYSDASLREMLATVLEAESLNPLDHPSDAPVSDEDRAAGILSWREIADDKSGNSVYLPVFRPDFFPEEERELIPKSGDPEHPEMYVDHFDGVYAAAVCWSELDETPTLWGEAGTGKTELFRHLAWLMQVPFRRVSVTGSTELDDLAGKMLFSQETGTYFQYGRLTKAWVSPGVIVIDEPNTGPPDVWQFLRPLTDNSKQLVLDMNKGEVLKRSDNTYLGMAMNPSWDPKNVGAAEIGDADANRLFHIYLELPPPAVEAEIIRRRVALDGWQISTDQLKMVMGIARDIRSLAESGALTITWAIRPQIKVARALRWFDPVVAYKRAVADYLEPEAQQVLLDAVRAHLS